MRASGSRNMISRALAKTKDYKENVKITFGMSLDGYEPPEQGNSLGAVVTGPSGMLGLLETRLGLSGEWPAQPIRVIQYQQCLEAADNAERFYSRSLNIDALAVAKVLLRWRDEWVELAGMALLLIPIVNAFRIWLLSKCLP